MFLIYSVGDKGNQVRLSQGMIVLLLVVTAIYANAWAFQRVGEIRRETAFQQELVQNLDALTIATDAIAASKPAH